MVRARRHLVWLLPFALAACDQAGSAVLLSSLDSFEGTVGLEVRADGSSHRVSGELSFDRALGRIELRRADGSSLRKHGDGPLELVRGDAVSPVTPDDLRDFTVLLTALHSAPDPDGEVEHTQDGYVMRAGGQELRVELRPVVPE